MAEAGLVPAFLLCERHTLVYLVFVKMENENSSKNLSCSVCMCVCVRALINVDEFVSIKCLHVRVNVLEVNYKLSW